MIDIYDEIGYIKEVLEKGIKRDKWQRDCRLLAHFYASNGMNKKECKEKLNEKLEKSLDKFYNPITMYQQLNKNIDIAYKEYRDGKELREIKEIEISKEVLEWFLNLEKNFTLSEEQIKEEYNFRKIKLKKNPLTFNRVKFLFTLYVWTKIQEKYIDYPYTHYLNTRSTRKKIKVDGELPISFNIGNEKNILYDLGFLYINISQGIEAKFIKEEAVFSIPINEDNSIKIKGEDLYKCGYWLTKQKYGYYVCKKCKREFAYKGLGKGEKRRIYCDECWKKVDSERHKNS